MDLYIRRMEKGAMLDAADRARLHELAERSSIADVHEDIVSEGNGLPAGHIVLEGLTASYKLLADGSRQIFHFMLPGDAWQTIGPGLKHHDASVVALTRSRIVRLTSEEVKAIAADHPNLVRAFWLSMLCDQAIMRERLISLGRRSADRRIAHLFCELLERYRKVGLDQTDGNGHATFDFPITQPELADAVGLTAVHVNRTLQQLRDADLVAFRARRVTILDEPRLVTFAGFDARYLALN